MGLPSTSIIRTTLEDIAKQVEESVSKNLSYRGNLEEQVITSIDKWKFGKTGYTSPTNILLTSAWVKFLNPEQDISICFVSKTGGYNGRDMDEKYTVPLVSKFYIYEQFCSRNSGFQGSRQIENQKRSGVLSREQFTGNVLWDTGTFFDIMEAINEDPKQAKNVFYYLLEKGFLIKNTNMKNRKKLSEKNSGSLDKISAHKLLCDEASKIRDPQFHKILVAAFLIELHEPRGLRIEGLEGARTGADARDGSPGDLWSEEANGDVIEGIEVKDFTHTFDWRNIAAAKDRVHINPGIKLYSLVTTNLIALSPEIASDEWEAHCERFLLETGTRIRAITLSDLIKQNWFVDFNSIIGRVSELLASGQIPDIKPGTIESWSEILHGNE